MSVLKELAKVKAIFQQRAICAAMGIESPSDPFHCRKCNCSGEKNFSWDGKCLVCEDEGADDNELMDNVWFFCPDCNEEYNLPESQITCPLCDCDQMVEL